MVVLFDNKLAQVFFNLRFIACHSSKRGGQNHIGKLYRFFCCKPAVRQNRISALFDTQ